MDMHRIVRRKPDFIMERMDDEIAVYHPSLTTSLYFNQTGALVWDLCDGNMTAAGIVGLLTGMYPESAAQIREEVPAIIGELIEHGIADLV